MQFTFSLRHPGLPATATARLPRAKPEPIFLQRIARSFRRSAVIPFGPVCRARYWLRRLRWGGGEPRTFLQKINWRIAHDRRPLLTMLADKITARDFIASRVGTEYLPVCFGTAENVNDIALDRLPDEFVAKPNHACGMVWFVTDRVPATPRSRDPFEPVFCAKRDLNREAFLARCREWLAIDYSQVNFEWAYKDVPRRILFEEYLAGPEGLPAFDHKFIVIGGRVRAIQVDSNRFGEHRRSYYSRTWEPLPVRYVKPPLLQEAPRPAQLAEMVAVAEIIGRDIDHVRVDTYTLADRFVIGELTIYHNAGCSAYDPVDFDRELGDAWTLPDGFWR